MVSTFCESNLTSEECKPEKQGQVINEYDIKADEQLLS
jgi:hypothetical protein